MLSDDVVEKGYALLCVAVPQSDCKVQTISEVRWMWGTQAQAQGALQSGKADLIMHCQRVCLGVVLVELDTEGGA